MPVRFRLGGEEASVVVEEAHVVAGAGFEFDEAAHDDDASPVADLFQLGPGFAIVFGDGHAGRVEAGEHDDAFFAFGIDDAVEGGDLFRRGPGIGGGEAVGPGEAAVIRAFVDDAAFAVAFWVDC